MKNKRSPFLSRTRPRTFRRNMRSRRRSAAFSASSRLFDLNGEASRVSKRQTRAIIAADVRRFGHVIIRTEFSVHTGTQLEVCAADTQVSESSSPHVPEHQINWKRLNNNWTPKGPMPQLRNINPVFGARESRKDNKYGLKWMHHFTLPVRDIALMDRFMIDLLDAERWSGDK